MGIIALFGITNDGLNLAVNLLVLFLVVLYVALIYWTFADARRRIEDPMLVGCATVAALFPFIGTIVYMIVRPPEYIEDRRERELEIAAAEARLASMEYLACPYCDFEVEKTFLRCPSCLRRLKEPCGTCGKPLDPRWKICPYCESEIGAAPRAASQQRRRVAPPTAEQPAVPRASGQQARPSGQQARPSGQKARPSGEARPSGQQARPSGQQARPSGEARPSSKQARPSGQQARPSGEQARPAARRTQ